MKYWLTHILPTLFLLSVISLILLFVWHKPRILIVMSYSESDSWEQGIRVGLDDGLKKQAPYVRTRYVYLDEHRQKNLAISNSIAQIHEIIKHWHPQVLILVDDPAQQYIAPDVLGKDHVSIVFAGVNDNAEAYHYHSGLNVTGIFENLHLQQLEQAVAMILPQYHRLIHLSDASQSSQLLKAQINAHAWSRLRLQEQVLSNDIRVWQQTIAQANREHDLVLITHMETVKDQTDRIIPGKKLMADILQQAKIPLMGLYTYAVAEGIPFAISTSAYEQGDVAMQLALKIAVDHVPAGTIPFRYSEYMQFRYNATTLKQTMPDVQIPELYRSLAYADERMDRMK
jgi:ABC-type uncharacterized transport system substrate-binding protein